MCRNKTASNSTVSGPLGFSCYSVLAIGLSYSYVVGNCQGQICGKYPDGHVQVSEIMDEFSMALSQALIVGLEQRLASKHPKHTQFNDLCCLTSRIQGTTKAPGTLSEKND